MAVAPPRPKGPPLNALRAFEAAGRLESFVLAGEELSVTPGAISQHIKALEAWIDTPLFQRNANGVSLTDAGQSLLPQFTQAFDTLGKAVRALNAIRPTAEIHIATMPSLAQLWLPSRLARIRREHPDLQLSVTALETPPNLGRELFDLSLFLREPEGRDGETIICIDEVFPVCSPELAKDLTNFRQLIDHQLLIDRTWAEDWEIWIKSADVSLQRPKTGAAYSLYSLALEEAKAGAGILMGHGCLVESALDNGSLVRPFKHSASTGRSLTLEIPPGRKADASLCAVADMIAELN